MFHLHTTTTHNWFDIENYLEKVFSLDSKEGNYTGYNSYCS